MNSLKLSTFIQGVKEKINTPEKWVQGSLYSDASGNPVNSTSEACQFCLQGAILAHSDELLKSTTPGSYWVDVMKDLRARAGMSLIKIGGQSVPRFNDTHSHAEVMSLLNKTIVKAQLDEATDSLQLEIK